MIEKVGCRWGEERENTKDVWKSHMEAHYKLFKYKHTNVFVNMHTYICYTQNTYIYS